MTERELFDTYNKDVYRTCYYMLRNKQDAEDVCHDVFITVFRQEWQQIEQLRAWIMRIAMNQCLNLIKKNQTQRQKQQQMQVLNKHLATTEKPIDMMLVEKAQAEEWNELLSKLPDKLITVVTLRYIGELSLIEIAETLKIPVGTVKSRLHKALKIMRKKMEHNKHSSLKGENQFGTF